MAGAPNEIIKKISQVPLAADAFSTTVQAIRATIQGRTQNQDILGRIKTPSYEQIRQKELSMLRGIDEVPNALEANGDWRTGGPIDHKPFNPDDPNKPTRNTPSGKTSYNRGLKIKDLVDFSEINIQFVPQELDYDPQSSFVAIASMARNNPLYHYTGSEDTLNFVLDWYAETENRFDVINNCKKLEALTKNDSFEKPPHHIKLIWGDNNIMFADSTWLVVAAPYKLSMFQAHRQMLPQQAIQTVTLKRVTEFNSTISQIQDKFF